MSKYLLLFLLCLPTSLLAQIQWGHRVGTENRDNLEQHIIDHEGNIIAVGYFGASLTLENHTLSVYEDNSEDTFIYKASPSGEILWAKALVGPSSTGDVGVSVDGAGNIYVAGGFVQELLLDGQTLLTRNSVSWNSYVCKFSKDGEFIWVRGVLGQTFVSEARVWGNVSSNLSGEVVIAVTIWGTVAVNGQVITNSGGKSLLILKFSPEGTLEWYINPDSDSNAEAKDIHIDNQGEIYVTGFYTGKLPLGSDVLQAVTHDYGDVFIAKLNGSGSPIWARSINKTSSAELNNAGQALAVNPVTKEIYLTGYFKGNIKAGEIVLSGVDNPENLPSTDIFVTKLSASGDFLWSNRHGTQGDDASWDLHLLQQGGLVISGEWYSRPFIMKMDELGNPSPILEFNSSGYALSVSPYSNNEFYVSGLFFGPFMEGNLDWNAIEGDGFMVRTSEACISDNTQLVTPILNISCTQIRITNYNGVGQITWYKDGIEIPSQSTSTLAFPTSGNYKASLQSDCNIVFSESIELQLKSFLPAKPVLHADCQKIIAHNQGNNTLRWYKNDLELPDVQGPTLQFQENGTYTAMFENECGSTINSINIDSYVHKDQYKIYNVITPDGNDKNEYFAVDPALAGASLQVYNRWGKKVFETLNYQNNWNGNGLLPAVYYWTLIHECSGRINGMLTIIHK